MVETTALLILIGPKGPQLVYVRNHTPFIVFGWATGVGGLPGWGLGLVECLFLVSTVTVCIILHLYVV